MNETELAASVVSWLQEQHWEIYQEVQYGYMGRVADIVARRGDILWIIECKTSYCFCVLEQATRWPVHYRSIAVPWARTPRDYRVALNYYQVGVLEVEHNSVEEIIDAPLCVRHHKEAKRIVSSLIDLHKTYALAGSRSGNHLTPYKHTMIEVRKVIENNPGCTIGFLYDQLGKQHYSSKDSFKGNLLKALEDFEKWCKIDKNSKPYKLSVLAE